MPRKARIDAPGAVHHIIARGIGRRRIFNDDQDRDQFLERMGRIVEQTQTDCFAWALIPNHFHLLLRTGTVPVATLMRRLLTGHAAAFNRRHRRSGHLLQNRYKSILCEQEPYLLELVRYIHLNPLRATLVKDMTGLERYSYCGHSAIMDKHNRSWQNTDAVLRRFGKTAGAARKKYRAFVAKGIARGKRNDLVGGGLVRSLGGWAAVKALRKTGSRQKGDERILGGGDFVEKVLKQAQKSHQRRMRIQKRAIDIETLARRIAALLDMSAGQVLSPGKHRAVVKARSLLCYLAVRELGLSMTSLAKRFNLSVTAISKAVERGQALLKKKDYGRINEIFKS